MAGILKNWHILSEVPGCKNKSKIGFRNVENLKKNLVRTDARREREEANRESFVKYGNCNVCFQAWEIDTLVILELNINNLLKFVASHATKHCVYLIDIWEFPKIIRTHISEHKSRIRNGIREAPLVEHF